MREPPRTLRGCSVDHPRHRRRRSITAYDVIDALSVARSDIAGAAESLESVAAREDDDHMRMLARVLDGDAALLREALQWLEGEER